MPDFAILKLDVDDRYIFIRRETVGGSTIGAPDYRSDTVVRHFSSMLNSKLAKGKKPTAMDEVAGRAQHIRVTVLHRLSNCEVSTADRIKRDEITKHQRTHPGRVINKR